MKAETATTEETKPTIMNVSFCMSTRLKSAVERRARELSRDVSKHLRRLVVDDLIAAGHITSEEGLNLS